MRLKIRFQPEKSYLILPCHYNGVVQAFIYRHLDEYLSKKIHDSGHKDPLSKRRIKLFTFSRLIPEKGARVEDGRIFLQGSITVIISSPLNEFLQSFASNLLRWGTVCLAGETLTPVAVEVEPVPAYKEKIIVKAISPITVYSTLLTPDGRKKTYYYNPFEKDFESLIIRNLQRKVRTWTGRDIEGGSVKPYRVSSRNERIVIYKNTVIKGWDGLYQLELPEELFRMAFESGLGSKNSQGFGCIEVWEEKHNEVKWKGERN